LGEPFAESRVNLVRKMANEYEIKYEDDNNKHNRSKNCGRSGNPKRLLSTRISRLQVTTIR